MDYGYMAQKLAAARSSLLLPHPRGIEQSVITAMFECMIGLDGLKDERPEELEPYLSRLVDLLDTSELSDPDCIGLHIVKARMFTEDQLHQFSSTVDELATLCASHRQDVHR
jgi:hypothetical protein